MIKIMIQSFFLLGLVAAMIFGGLRLYTSLYAAPRIFSAEEVLPKPVAIVFGAGLRWDGSPTAVLRDRVATAVRLYYSGKVSKILMSGDNRFDYYNEPEAMRRYAIQLGVPDDAIVLDYAGHRTYDTCYRAREIFDVQDAILVTQAFHLPRAIYTCNKLNVEAVGVRANSLRYRTSTRLIWNIREKFATLVAIWDVHIAHPIPILGEKEPIIPLEIQ